MEKSSISRRDFLKFTLASAGIVLTDVPAWIDKLKDDQFENLMEICTQFLETEQVLDILDAKLDLQGAIGECFSFLMQSGQDPESLLIEHAFLMRSQPGTLFKD